MTKFFRWFAVIKIMPKRKKILMSANVKFKAYMKALESISKVEQETSIKVQSRHRTINR
jgi:hypothetical protein